MKRWTSVRGTRVVESEDAENYRYLGGRLERIMPEVSFIGDHELGLTTNPVRLRA
jgi:hypothetical protein